MKKNRYIHRREFLNIGGRSLFFLGMSPMLSTINGCAEEEEEQLTFTKPPLCSSDDVKWSGDDFSIVLMTDTHADMACSFENLNKMSQWIVENEERLNIMYVAHQGDIADGRGSGDIGEMLRESREALQPIVNSGIPFSAAIGNHDYDVASHSRSCLEFNHPEAFGGEFYQGSPHFGGTFEEESNDPGLDPGGTVNHYFTRRIGGQDLLFLCLELYPRDKVMEWCDSLVHNKFPDHQVMVITHSYLNRDGKLQSGGPSYVAFSSEVGSPEYSNGGGKMWGRYFRHWKNLIFISNGHFIGGLRQNYLQQKGANGNVVHSHFWNYQGWGYANGELYVPGPGGGENQAAMLKIIHFRPNANEIYIENYMPPINIEADPANPDLHILAESCV